MIEGEAGAWTLVVLHSLSRWSVGVSTVIITCCSGGRACFKGARHTQRETTEEEGKEQ